MSMKHLHKLSTVPMGNPVNPMPTIGSIEVCHAKDPRLFCFKALYHGLDLSLKILRKAIPERLFVMGILPMTSWKELPSRIVGPTFVVIGSKLTVKMAKSV